MQRTRVAALVFLALAVLTLAAVLSAPAAALPARPAAAPAAPRAAPSFTFRTYPYDLRLLPVSARPFASSIRLPRVDPGVHDKHGVRMRRTHGVLYDFPRGQSTYGLLNLSSYLSTDDAFYLDRALLQARRLRDTRVVAGDAWYYPNRPSKHRHGNSWELIPAPYYSSLSQGRVLMFFSRLAEVTGDTQWREAADHTFLSFLRPGPRSGPYCVDVDARGYLWLQEWPWPGMKPDDTFNGHNSAAFGVFEYWCLTQDPRADEVFRGAATTSQVYAGAFRNKGWLSLYCLAHHDVANPFYHSFHVGQLLQLCSMTGAVRFAEYADAFSADYPRSGPATSMTIQPGRYAAFRFGPSGAVVARRTVTVPRTVTSRVTRRTRMVRGGPIMLRVAAAPCAGWWLEEQPGKVYADGPVVVLRYDPDRSVSLAAGGSYRAVLYDRRGILVGSVTLQPVAPLTLAVDAGAIVEGAPAVRLAEGDQARYWLRLGAGARLR
jgi:hypothetical protein